MADFVTVYDLDGKELQLDHVDAREYLAAGLATAAPIDPDEAAAKAKADEEARKIAADVMTVDKDGVDIREASPKSDHEGKPLAKPSAKAKGTK